MYNSQFTTKEYNLEAIGARDVHIKLHVFLLRSIITAYLYSDKLCS